MFYGRVSGRNGPRNGAIYGSGMHLLWLPDVRFVTSNVHFHNPGPLGTGVFRSTRSRKPVCAGRSTRFPLVASTYPPPVNVPTASPRRGGPNPPRPPQVPITAPTTPSAVT